MTPLQISKYAVQITYILHCCNLAVVLILKQEMLKSQNPLHILAAMIVLDTLLLISLAHQTHAYAHVPLASPARAHTSLLYGEEQRVGQAN